MRLLLISIIASFFVPTPAAADVTDTEVEFLVSAVGESNCTFIRNGKRHSAEDAEDHLRMKYRRGKRYAPTAEKFIERLASASSMSKKPYYIECKGQDAVPSGDWLTAQLVDYRSKDSGPL
jgi:hypothetical protein